MKIAIRKYLGEWLISQENVESDDCGESLAAEHLEEMADGKIDCVEIEFLGDDDPKTRYFRIGTNPARMRDPIKIDSETSPESFMDRWGKE